MPDAKLIRRACWLFYVAACAFAVLFITVVSVPMH
jgi:hypothetical protein